MVDRAQLHSERTGVKLRYRSGKPGHAENHGGPQGNKKLGLMPDIILRLRLMNFSIYQSTRVGGRQYNQDRVAYAYSEQALLMVLADGMGGHLHGETAAEMAVQTFMRAFDQAAQPRVPDPEEFLREVMQQAHDAIIQYAHDQQLGGNPGTTCVVVLVQDGKACWAHAGDSRLYLLRGAEVTFRTHDHSMVQQWADWGIITAEEMKIHPDRNKITNCLGGVEDMFFVESSVTVPLHQGDILLLCSDGLWNPLSETEMASALNPAPTPLPLPAALEQLMAEAAYRGGENADNITAIAARWSDAEESHSTPVPVMTVLDCS